MRTDPRATYRIQFGSGFWFRHAAEIADYLADLGVSHLYASPYLASASGTHGYDVVDHTRLEPRLGGEEAHREMCERLAAHGIAQLLDVVPNHMAISGRENRAWWDVLANGQASRYATFFDIDWRATASDEVNVQIRSRESTRLLGELERLLGEEPAIGEALDAVVAEINASPDDLDEILERQNYRLAFWRAGGRDLTYRRFFDIDTLIGVRVEDEEVFRAVHERVLAWVRDGVADGLRIDHVDGLRDPLGYLERLRAEAPDAWLLVERILSGDERLPASWPVEGTTGYEFANRATGVLIDPTGAAQLTKLYERFTGRTEPFDALVRDKKLLVLRELLGSDLNRLTALFLEVCERHGRHRDYTRHELHEVLREALVCMPVYRTYVRPEVREVRDEDVAIVEGMVACAKANRPDLDPSAFDFLADVLLLRTKGIADAELATRFQQVSAPTMAKGVEDTAFYVFNRFIALNEVGGEPLRFGVSVEELHRASSEALESAPYALLATSTHDTKRSADVRARLALLSEMPEEWAAAVERWARLNERHWAGAEPDRNVEYLLYQTLVGAWPIGADRVLPYLEKTIREAKERTSWTQVDERYEASVRGFAEDALGDEELVRDLEAFVAPLVEPGRVNALTQELLKLTSPGVPDVYQGSELWDLSLVDPDNRRPVDFALRRRLLTEIATLGVDEVVARSDEGLPKLWLVKHALELRRRAPEAFGERGSYQPMWATGSRAQHAVAYARGGRVIAVGVRLPWTLAGAWEGTSIEIPGGGWRNVLTGETVASGACPLDTLLARFPVALLAHEELAA